MFFLYDIYEDAFVTVLLLSLRVTVKLLVSQTVKLAVPGIALTVQLCMSVPHMQNAKWTKSPQRCLVHR